MIYNLILFDVETSGENNSDIFSVSISCFPYTPKYFTISGNRVFYIDEGPQNARPVLLIHGVPTWSYLFRNIIPQLLAHGYRVIAPDLPGFGRSDKPSDRKFYTFDNLSEVLRTFVSTLNLNKLVVMGHDWGAILAMRLAAEYQSVLSGLTLCNGYLPRGDEKPHIMFNLWKLITRFSPILPIGNLINQGCLKTLEASDIAAYNLPFSSEKEKLAIRILPGVLPFKNASDIEKSKTIWDKLESSEIPVLTIFSKNDPITRGGQRIIKQYLPGSKKQNHILIPGGHFVPEDAPDDIANSIIQFTDSL